MSKGSVDMRCGGGVQVLLKYYYPRPSDVVQMGERIDILVETLFISHPSRSLSLHPSNSKSGEDSGVQQMQVLYTQMRKTILFCRGTNVDDTDSLTAGKVDSCLHER